MGELEAGVAIKMTKKRLRMCMLTEHRSAQNGKQLGVPWYIYLRDN